MQAPARMPTPRAREPGAAPGARQPARSQPRTRPAPQGARSEGRRSSSLQAAGCVATSSQPERNSPRSLPGGRPARVSSLDRRGKLVFNAPTGPTFSQIDCLVREQVEVPRRARRDGRLQLAGDRGHSRHRARGASGHVLAAVGGRKDEDVTRWPAAQGLLAEALGARSCRTPLRASLACRTSEPILSLGHAVQRSYFQPTWSIRHSTAPPSWPGRPAAKSAPTSAAGRHQRERVITGTATR